MHNSHFETILNSQAEIQEVIEMSNQFRIRELRRVRGLTQAQLAFRLDLKSPIN